jgi:fatty acid-binding protein DegV
VPITKKMSKAETFHDLRHGKTFKKTEKTRGKKTAVKQMVAIAAKEGKLGKPKRGSIAHNEKTRLQTDSQRKHRNKSR